MTDIETITYQVLTQSGTALNGLVGSRVDFAETPERFQNTEARLVFRPEGGDDSLWGSPVAEASFLFECYGGNGEDRGYAGCKAVYEALRALWVDAANVAVDDGVFMSGFMEQRGTPVVHPEFGFRYYVARMGGRFRGA